MKVSHRLERGCGELAMVLVVLLDVVWSRTSVAAACALCVLLWSYVRYRREAVLNYRHSAPIRDRMSLEDVRHIENKYTRREDYSSPEKRALVRGDLDRYFYYVRYERVQALLDMYAADARSLLDMGCGFGQDTVYAGEQLERTAIGLDLDELKLAWARREASGRNLERKVAFICADAASPPLRPGSFDCIVITEALEHLISPTQGLAACHELLCHRGILIITVPSRHNLAYSNNPFIILEKILSLLSDKVLTPYHNLHAKFEYDWRNPEPEYGMHYNFSRQGLEHLLREAGFTLIHKGSFEVEIFPYLLIELLCRGDLERIRKYVSPLEAIITSLPVSGGLGQHLVWVARRDDPTVIA